MGLATTWPSTTTALKDNITQGQYRKERKGEREKIGNERRFMHGSREEGRNSDCKEGRTPSSNSQKQLNCQKQIVQ